eukprot:Selendium_serpulae@DN2351_c0_g1_i1.p2
MSLLFVYNSGPLDLFVQWSVDAYFTKEWKLMTTSMVMHSTMIIVIVVTGLRYRHGLRYRYGVGLAVSSRQRRCVAVTIVKSFTHGLPPTPCGSRVRHSPILKNQK